MLLDQNLSLSQAQAVTVTSPSTFTYDILKGNSLNTATGTYAVPSNDIIGNTAFFGEDLGGGRGLGEPVFVVSSGAAAPAGATSLQIAVQGAPDNGGGTIAGLAFTTYVSTGAIPMASILASSRLARLAWPRRAVGAALPRFINLLYTVVGGPFTGLVVNADVTLGPDDSGTVPQYPSNF